MAALSPSWQVTCSSAAALQTLASRLAAQLPPGSLLALDGALGAGKTTFVQGLARGLGVVDLGEVVSPTYSLVHDYPAARTPLIHIDCYRLEAWADACALGLDEQMGRRDAVVAVEWASKFAAQMPAPTVQIHLAMDAAGGRSCRVAGLQLPAATA